MTPPSATAPLLEIRDLTLSIPVAAGMLHALRGVDLTVQPGRTLGVVGESGSGKSLTALSVMGLQPAHGRREAGRLAFAGEDLLAMDERALAARIRGRRIGMIFQEPMTSLNPVMTVGRQLTEAVTLHGLMTPGAAKDRAVALLERVGIAGAGERLAHYPHQFSGGQRQRLMIAMALMPSPDLLIADEPTTALDVTVQAEILRLLAELRAETGMGLVLVTHNLGLVSRIADDVAVMYAGQVVEQAPAAALFAAPRHPYTQGLLAALPEARAAGERLGSIAGVVPALIGGMSGCGFAPRCPHAEARCRESAPPLAGAGDHRWRCIHDADLPALAAPAHAASALADSPLRETGPVTLAATGLERRYGVRRGLFSPKRSLRAVAGVDLTLAAGEALAIVGESGCGKSTLARLLLGLERADAGAIRLAGQDVASLGDRARARLIQPVFQDPRGSLNPRHSVGAIIRRPLDIHGLGSDTQRMATVRRLMAEVGLPERLLHAFPSQLSGGQRQRVAIARALALQPSVLLCDEPTSALDVSVQAQILNLLADLRDRMGLGLILITHDLGVVRHMADRVAVMYLGQIVEEAATAMLFENPAHPYTRALIASALPVRPGSGIPEAPIRPGFPNPLERPAGCGFAPRCPLAMERCFQEAPTLQPTLQTMPAGRAACHLVPPVHRAAA